MTTSDTATLEAELAAARLAWKQFAVKPSRIRIVYEEDYKMGWGGYATVYRATLKKRWWWWTKAAVAVKRFSVAEDYEELKIWAALKHPNILAFRGFHVSEDLGEVWLISTLATKGDLYSYLGAKDPPLLERLSLAKDTAKGLEYLHTRDPPICHGDIKSLNILIGSNGHAIICDFGTARQDGLVLPATGTTKPHAGGTPRYSSPELFDGESLPTITSDIWSWGCLFHEIVTGLGPYSDVAMESQIIYQIIGGNPPAHLDRMDCSAPIRELLRSCWRIEPHQRPTMTECLNHLSGVIIEACRKEKRLSSADGRNVDAILDRLEGELNEVLDSLKDFRLEPSSIVLPPSGGVVGNGGYGVVFRATMTRGENTEEVAVKTLRANGNKERRLQMAIAVIRELRVSANLEPHPNILPFIGFHLTKNLGEAWLVSPFMSIGDLSRYLQQPTLSGETRMKLALDVAKGLEYLHSLNICHGDIKSQNALVTNDQRVVLCDFGLAKSMENMPTGLTTTTFNQGGTLAYESPELIMQSSHRTLESDVWAWGCLLQEIHTGKPPYYWANNPGAIVKWITTDIPPAILEDVACPPPVRSLLLFCWQFSATMRPTMVQCVAVLSGDLSQLPATSDRLERIMRMKLMRSELGLRKGEILGSGACGTVYRGTMTKLGTDNAVEVAIKGVCIVDEDDDAKRQRLFNDLRDASADWAGLRNPNILPFLGLCIDSYGDPEILLVSPFVVGGNLSDYLKGQSLGDAKKIDMASGIAEGLLYLYTRNPPIHHGNLHPWNILINEKGGVVLSDYGFAQVMNKAGVKTKVTGDVEMSSRYWSPEIVTGRVPYDGVEDAPAVVDELACPPRVQNLLGLCWKKDQTLRPAISEVLAILDGKPFRYENVHSINANSVECLKLSRDGTKLAVAYKDCVEVYSTRDGKQLLDFPLPDEYGTPTCVRHSHSGRYLAVGTAVGLVAVWNIDEGKGVRRFSDSDNRLNDVDVSSDGAWAASVPSGRTVHLTHLAGNSGRDRTLATVKGTYSVAFSPAANILAAGLAGGGLQIFNVDTGESLAVLGGTAIACSLSFSSDGRWLFEGGDEGLLKWDTSRLAKLTPEARLYDGSVYHVAISPDNNTVAFLDPESAVRIRIGQVLVVPTASNVEIGRVPSHSIDHQDVAVSNGGSGVAVGWTRGTKEVRVYHYSSYGSPGTYRIDRLGSEDLDAEEVAVYNQRRRTFSIESSPRSLPRFGGGENVEGSEMGEAVDGVESGSLLFYE